MNFLIKRVLLYLKCPMTCIKENSTFQNSHPNLKVFPSSIFQSHAYSFKDSQNILTFPNNPHAHAMQGDMKCYLKVKLRIFIKGN